MADNPTQSENGGLKQEKIKKILRIAGDVLLGILLVFAAFVLVVTITAKKDSDGSSKVFGYKLYFVQSGSMEKCEYVDVSEYKIKSIPVKSCIFVSTVPEDEAELKEWYKTVKIGDVLTFRYSYDGGRQETITHRVVKIDEKGDGFVFTLRGDNRNSEEGVLDQVIDTTVAENLNYIIGRVTGQSYFLGLLVYAFRQPVGIILLIIVPCMVIIAFQVMRIVKVLNEEKKEKSNAQELKQKSEIEELKRQIEMLKQGVGGNENSAGASGGGADESNGASESSGADGNESAGGAEISSDTETNE